MKRTFTKYPSNYVRASDEFDYAYENRRLDAPAGAPEDYCRIRTSDLAALETVLQGIGCWYNIEGEDIIVDCWGLDALDDAGVDYWFWLR